MYLDNGCHIVEERFKNFMFGFNAMHNQKGRRLQVGVMYSCGIDSTVLLDVVNKFKDVYDYNVKILYVSFDDFAQSERADALAIQVAKEYKNEVKFSICSLKSKTGSVKEEARNAMKDLGFSEAFDLILTGHHADDQLETVLFRLFRGTGVEGLRGMDYVTEFIRDKETRLFGKPFLDIPKAALIDYGRLTDLTFIEDETNFNVDMSDRNYIRHNIIPLVDHRFNLSSILNTIENIKEYVSDTQQRNTDLDIYSGEWNVNDFFNLSIGNRVFLIREYFRTIHGYNFSQSVVKELRKKLEDDMTDLCISLGNSFMLVKDKNVIKVDYVKSVSESV